MVKYTGLRNVPCNTKQLHGTCQYWVVVQQQFTGFSPFKKCALHLCLKPISFHVTNVLPIFLGLRVNRWFIRVKRQQKFYFLNVELSYVIVTY